MVIWRCLVWGPQIWQFGVRQFLQTQVKIQYSHHYMLKEVVWNQFSCQHLIFTKDSSCNSSCGRQRFWVLKSRRQCVQKPRWSPELAHHQASVPCLRGNSTGWSEISLAKRPCCMTIDVHQQGANISFKAAAIQLPLVVSTYMFYVLIKNGCNFKKNLKMFKLQFTFNIIVYINLKLYSRVVSWSYTLQSVPLIFPWPNRHLA